MLLEYAYTCLKVDIAISCRFHRDLQGRTKSKCGFNKTTFGDINILTIRRIINSYFITISSKSLTDLADGVKYCRTCHNISDTDECDICANPSRDRSTICVVENIQNVMAIENTGQFRGLYHVLGGVISPMDGIGPNDLELQSLVDRVASGSIEEIILALNPTMEGDTTNFYIQRKLAGHNVRLSVLARGVSIGDDLEYTDEVTLGRSIINRTILK